MSKLEVRDLVLDFGNTLHRFSQDRPINWMTNTFGIPRHFFWEMISRYPDGILFPYECGQPTKQFIKAFRKGSLEVLMGWGEKERKVVRVPEFTDQEFIENWNLIWDPWPMDRGIISFLRKLKKRGHRIYVLSNTNRANLECVQRFAPELFEIVDRFFASCDRDIRCRKTRPDGTNQAECEKIFWKVLEIIGSRPEETVFVDDIKEFVDTFCGMGGHGIHHRGSWTKTEWELYQLGIRW